jgi:DNA-binding transcriptional MocR family regulator
MRRINERIWPPGELIPGEVELAEEFGCARATVNRALRELADEGLLERRRKAGTRVVRDPVRKARLDIAIIRLEVEGRGMAYRFDLLEEGRGSRPPGSPPLSAWLAARSSCTCAPSISPTTARLPTRTAGSIRGSYLRSTASISAR